MDGSPLAGRTLLIHAEQGLGDTLFFLRFAPALREHRLLGAEMTETVLAGKVPVGPDAQVQYAYGFYDADRGGYFRPHRDNTTGGNNIAVGLQAGFNLTTGHYNIAIGTAGGDAEGNTIRIGLNNALPPLQLNTRLHTIKPVLRSPLGPYLQVHVGMLEPEKIGEIYNTMELLPLGLWMNTPEFTALGMRTGPTLGHVYNDPRKERLVIDLAHHNIGDTIRFDILGRVTPAKVTSVRVVDWADGRAGGRRPAE